MGQSRRDRLSGLGQTLGQGPRPLASHLFCKRSCPRQVAPVGSVLALSRTESRVSRLGPGVVPRPSPVPVLTGWGHPQVTYEMSNPLGGISKRPAQLLRRSTCLPFRKVCDYQSYAILPSQTTTYGARGLCPRPREPG